MSLLRVVLCCCLLISFFTLDVGPAAGQAALLDQRVSLGTPARELALSLRAEPQLTLTVGAKRHLLAAKNVSKASLEVVQLGEGKRLAIVRLDTSDGSYAALLGGRAGSELLAFGRTDLHGDLGERSALAIDVSPAGAHKAVTVGVRHEALRLCADLPLLSNRRVVSPTSLSLVQEPWKPAELAAVPASAADPAEAPLVAALAAQSSSNLDPATGAPTPARALVDGDRASSWQVEPYGVATFHAAITGLSLERVVLHLPKADQGQRPEEVWLLGDEGKAVRVALPAQGESVAIPLQPAWSARCLALVLGQGRDAPRPVALLELVAYTQADRAGGVDGLVGQVVRGGTDADMAARVLSSLGKPGALALAARFDELPSSQKLRALPLFGRGLSDDLLRSRVVAAARSQDETIAAAGLAVLQHAGGAARPALRELALDATATGDTAAKMLAREPEELPALLAALAKNDNEHRPELRRAIATNVRLSGAAAQEPLSAWLAGQPAVSARAALGLALSGEGPMQSLATVETTRAAKEAALFEDRYRVALASGELTPSAELDAWLERQSTEASEWMMRHAAFSALSARSPQRAELLASKIVSDPYPRVRALAVGPLAKAQAQQVATVARQDRWPLVRAAAVRALAIHKGSNPSLRQALEDPARIVRAAAIDALASQRDSGAWPLVRARLTADNEWPEVRTSAIRFAAALCRSDAREELVALLRKALRPDANEDDQSEGLAALGALHTLGGAAAADARTIASREGAPPSLLQELAQLPEASCVQSQK